jgi:glutamine synthetase
MNKNELLSRVREDGVKFISLQFTDVTGAVKSADIPAGRLIEALDAGIWFDGSSVEGFARIQESDMRLILDPDTYAVLPWSPPEFRRARIFCDIFQPDGKPFPGDPRGTLKRVLERINGHGWTLTLARSQSSFYSDAMARRSRMHPHPASIPCHMTWVVISIFLPTMKRLGCGQS